MMNALSTLIAGVVLGALSFQLSAQNESDELRYGWIDPLHSARVTSMGGAFGALGADLSCLGMNPAGLGLYRRGDLSVSAGIQSGSTESQWGDRKVDAAGNALIGSNIGVALTYPSVDADWPFFTLAVAHQNRSPFVQNINIQGVPANSSVSDLFVTQAQEDAALYGFLSTDSALGEGVIFPFGAALAWQSGLLEPDNASGYSTLAGDNVLVNRTIDRSGRLAETQIGFGTMYQDWISFGLTLGIPKVEYEETSKHTEEVNIVSNNLQRWEYNESLRITGRGYLLRVGVLARVSAALRVGLAYQSRSRLTLTDTYNTDLQTTWLDNSSVRASAPRQRRYPLPARQNHVERKLLLGKLGVLNADYVRSDMRRGELGESEGPSPSTTTSRRRTRRSSKDIVWCTKPELASSCVSAKTTNSGFAVVEACPRHHLPERPSSPTPIDTVLRLEADIASAMCTSVPRGEPHGTAKTFTSWGPSLPNLPAPWTDVQVRSSWALDFDSDS